MRLSLSALSIAFAITLVGQPQAAQSHSKKQKIGTVVSKAKTKNARAPQKKYVRPDPGWPCNAPKSEWPLKWTC